jgi:outer membrane protein TolC
LKLNPSLALFLGCVLAAAGLRADGLDLPTYLDQVRQGNDALRGAQAQDAALALEAKQPLTAFSPQLSGNIQRLDNQIIPIGASALAPIETQSLSWDANLSELLNSGTKITLDYAGDNTNLIIPPFNLPASEAGFASGLSTFFPPSGFNMGQTVTLSVNQSLWRNFMAAEVDADLDKARADSDAARAGNRYQAQALLLQARQAYAQLATLRQVQAILNESLDRNQKILDWTKAKFEDNLADKVDVLQCEAALRQVALNLAQNKQDEAKAEVAFNTLRGASPTAAVEALGPLSEPEALPEAKDSRQDLEAARAALRSSDAVVAGVVQKFTPDVSVFVDFGEGERSYPSSDTVPGVLTGEHPDTLVGLKFSANLDVVLYRQVLAGAQKARGSGEAALADKKRQLDNDWEQLRAGFASVKEQLTLARELEDLQKEKAEREKVRYQDGRTTNFQVLRFEDDYNLSRIQTLQLIAQAVGLDATARFYNGDDQPW